VPKLSSRELLTLHDPFVLPFVEIDRGYSLSMVDLFISFESNSRKAISQMEAGWPALGPDEVAFWNCDEAHKDARVLYFVGGKLNAFIGYAMYSSDWVLSSSGLWKGEYLIYSTPMTRFSEFVSAADVKRQTGLPIPRDAMQVPDHLAANVWKAVRGLPSTSVDRRMEGMVTESKSRYRDPALRSAALAQADGCCAGCGKNYRQVAGGKGEKCLVVHHKKQLKDTDQPAETRLADLAVVCANCHMMIHADREKALTIAQLRKLLNR
jgi:5-methylcytosine-specific restriction endonuclease McrA